MAGDGLLGRGGNVHTRGDQTRAHAEARAGVTVSTAGLRPQDSLAVRRLGSSWEDGLGSGEQHSQDREDGIEVL